MKKNKLLIIFFSILFISVILLSFYYLSLKFGVLISGIILVILVSSIFLLQQMIELEVLIYSINKTHPAVYWGFDSLKLLIKNPYPKNKELRKNIFILRIMFFIILTLVLTLIYLLN